MIFPLPAAELLSLAREVVVARGGTLAFRVHGESMAPVLVDGDLVSLWPARLRPGSLVLAELSGKPLLHRLVRLEGGKALLRSDACLREDWLDLRDLLGEVAGIERSSRRFGARAKAWLRRTARELQSKGAAWARGSQG